MRILHIITSLDMGGAQWVLVQLIQQLQNYRHEQCVISMKAKGELAEKIDDLGIPLHEISFSPGTFLKARRQCEEIIRSFQPEVIQSWMYHADFLTCFLRASDTIPIVWGLHHSYETQNQNNLRFLTKCIVKMNALFSKIIPKKVICCSISAMETHASIGYTASKMVFIPNGVDVARFTPDLQARETLRKEIGVPLDTPIIGYIARYHPQKDHTTFFEAANQLLSTQKGTHFVLAGDGVVAENPDIQKFLISSKQPSCFHLLGRRMDVSMITAGLDVATLSSSGDEAFPLTVIEAMACAIPCVATDVGDVKKMIGNNGIIVPPQNSLALVKGWLTILNFPPAKRAELGRAAREWVLDHYTTEAMAEQYVAIYNEATCP